ncbi:hypothetical protein Dsin_018556 [Dipteronia sinensis]|uniref:Uncharacterized protein n=1 Tax=Dipteronia sinensis TaxID=43782 RepID=A0AAE0A5I4_9ROSI|nr:hypothetical protein Dsin_018556 [Dipteronia sinensis]
MNIFWQWEVNLSITKEEGGWRRGTSKYPREVTSCPSEILLKMDYLPLIQSDYNCTSCILQSKKGSLVSSYLIVPFSDFSFNSDNLRIQLLLLELVSLTDQLIFYMLVESRF